jgi:small-conductance mechanosensitive channel
MDALILLADAAEPMAELARSGPYGVVLALALGALGWVWRDGRKEARRGATAAATAQETHAAALAALQEQRTVEAKAYATALEAALSRHAEVVKALQEQRVDDLRKSMAQLMQFQTECSATLTRVGDALETVQDALGKPDPEPDPPRRSRR